MGERRFNGVLLERLLFGFWSLCPSLVATLGEPIPTLLAGGVPRFLPSLIADAIAQGQHRIHVGAFPAHAAAFQAGLNHELVGALHHPRTNRPTCTAEERILHQGEPFAQIA